MRHPTRQDLTVRNLRAMERRVEKLERLGKAQGHATRELILAVKVLARELVRLRRAR